MGRDDNPRVIIITASVGSGHNQAARAIIDSLSAAAPGINIEFVDCMELVPRFFRAYYAGGFALSMSHFPRLYGLGFGLSDRPQTPTRSLSERFKLAWERRCLGRLHDLVLQRQPNLIIHTHFLAAPITARLIASGQLRSRQVTVATDIYLHRWWYNEGSELWFLPHDWSAQQAVRWGIDPKRLVVSGIPLRQKWSQPIDRNKVFADWSLPQGKQIVLLSGGTEFTTGPVVKVAQGIVDAYPQVCVAVLAGRNKKLLAQLSKSPHPSGRLMALGFTDRMHELLEVASLMVTKAGGITTAECLSKGKPMVFLKPVPGQEGENAKFFQREGAGVITTNTRQVIQTVGRILGDQSELGRLSQNAARLFKPGAQIIRDRVLELLQ